MKNTWFIRILVLILCVGLLLTGCGEMPDVSTGGGTTAPAKTTSAVPTASTDLTNSTTIPSAVPQADYALARATYPSTLTRPEQPYGKEYTAWSAAVADRQKQLEGQTDGMTEFYARTMDTFLAGEPGENRVYSPLNVYLALSMLVETTGGNSRTQLLKLLGVSDLAALRRKNAALWNGVYLDDGVASCRLANSLWLTQGDNWSYNTDTVNRLAQAYHASVFRGIMGDPAYDQMLQTWVNEQTGNLLQEQARGLSFNPNTVLSLVSAIYYRGAWFEDFSPYATRDKVFHTHAGDVTVPFMHRTEIDGRAYFGADFTAVKLKLDTEGYTMCLFLPKKGVGAETLAGNAQVLAMLQGSNTLRGGKMNINLSIPKFDVVSDQSLVAGLKSLGVTDIFGAAGDFSEILSAPKGLLYVDGIQHAARVTIDEDGVVGAAYTGVTLSAKGVEQEEKKQLDFTLDRPFMFAITGPGDTILFTGIVEKP